MAPVDDYSSDDSCSMLLQPYVYNLTSSYADQSNEAAMVATSVVMLVLAALFFNLNLFSAFSDISAFLLPSIRPFLSASLSLFLPVMSYLLSQANNSEKTTDELSLRARTILTWMLLVELLRKKVEGMILSTGGGGGGGGLQGYSGTIERASRIAWLGYLIFYNIRSAGKRAFYGTLWVLAAAKLLQRFVTSELAKRSFAYGKNPQLIASYMRLLLSSSSLQEESRRHDELFQHQQEPAVAAELLKRCNYVVMGEEELEKKAATDGYHLPLEVATEDEEIIARSGDHRRHSSIVKVGKIWKLAETDEELLKSDPSLKRLCLSYALYKLLRRRLEGYPITDAEAWDCHRLIFQGLCKEQGDDDTKNAVALFQVFNDEAHFLCEYYHSVLPVMFATPFFFLANYILFPLVVGALCVLTIILISNGDVGYAFVSFRRDNYGVAVGVMRILTCLMRRMRNSPMNTFASVDVCITILLALTFAYEQAWEFLVFIFSNWFMVSLLCSYYASQSQSQSQSQQQTRARRLQLIRGVIRGILWARNMVLTQPNVSVKQFSAVLCRFPWLPCYHSKQDVPKAAKEAIMKRLAAATLSPPSNGRAALEEEHHDAGDLSWACDGGVADVMLTWHIATAMLEARHPQQVQPGPASRKVATTLSAYCAYLVAFSPELLPGDKDGAERVYKDMKKELKKEMGCWRYYWSSPSDRCDKLMEMAGAGPRPKTRTEGEEEEEATVLRNGARLGKALIDRYPKATGAGAMTDDEEGVWKLLADVWTEVLVYAAPTAGELHAKAHREALAQGGEFITILWAIATHTGITRRQPAAVTSSTPANSV